MREEWLIWCPVVAGYATLREVEEHWSLQDCKDAVAIYNAINSDSR